MSATISEPCTTQDRGADTRFISPYFLSMINPCLIHGVLHRTATPSESKNARCFKDFYEILKNGVTQAKAVCLCQFAKISVFDTSKHKVCQGNMHCLSLAHQQKTQSQKGYHYYERQESKIRKRCNAYRKSMGALRPTCK